MNIDGRFLSIDDIRWGLREWYPVDTDRSRNGSSR